MFNVNLIKKVSLILGITTTMMISSCSNGTKSETDKANLMLTQAQELLKANDYSNAIALIDSLKNVYPTAIDVQRKALHLRIIVEEKIILRETVSNDSLLAISSAQKAKLEKNFTYVKTPDMVEGYYVMSSANRNPLIQRTGIEARINEQNKMYIVSLLFGKSINHTRLSVTSGNGGSAATQNVAYNGSTNYHFKNDGISNEMVTFRAEQCDTLCQFVTNNINANLKINFIGKSRHSMPLSNADKKMISDTYTYSVALQELKSASGKKIYLENKLKINQDQIKRTAIK
ncbi:MAG: hypothetical protein RR442_00485 [Muribaculaceae bacterium]